MILSIVIPAQNEERNIARCLEELRGALMAPVAIPYEVVVVDDNSSDGTAAVVAALADTDTRIRLVRRVPPAGFGRAVRDGIDAVTGDVLAIYMADLSDDPQDLVACYHKIAEGYDCVFGSRFIAGSQVTMYPVVKLVVNRFANQVIRWMFWSHFNDFTNAFKVYRMQVAHDCGPYRASHFNITLEMSIGALIRGYRIVEIPIRWHGRTWGSSKLRLSEMGRRYLSTLLMLFFQRVLISDDLLAERAANNARFQRQAPPAQTTVEAG